MSLEREAATRLIVAEQRGVEAISYINRRYIELQNEVNLELYSLGDATDSSKYLKLQEVLEELKAEVRSLERKKKSAVEDCLEFCLLAGYYISLYDLYKLGYEIDYSKSVEYNPGLLFDNKTYTARIATDYTWLVYNIEMLFKQRLLANRELYDSLDAIDRLITRSRNSNNQTLVESYVNLYFNFGKQAAYEDAEVDRYVFSAILDDRTTEACRELDGRTFRVADAEPFVNFPPIHFRCRSTTYPLTIGGSNAPTSLEEFLKKFDNLSDEQLNILLSYY